MDDYEKAGGGISSFFQEHVRGLFRTFQRFTRARSQEARGPLTISSLRHTFFTRLRLTLGLRQTAISLAAKCWRRNYKAIVKHRSCLLRGGYLIFKYLNNLILKLNIKIDIKVEVKSIWNIFIFLIAFGLLTNKIILSLSYSCFVHSLIANYPTIIDTDCAVCYTIMQRRCMRAHRNYRRHMATPYGPGSIKSSVSAHAARIERDLTQRTRILDGIRVPSRVPKAVI